MRNKYKGQDIRARLGNTLIRYKGLPVICQTDGDGTTLTLFQIRDGQVVAQVDPDDQNIDISSMTLGYVNTGDPYKCATYVKRLPRRMYKQGIDLSYLQFDPLSTKFGSIDHGRLMNEVFENSLCDKFPSFARAMESITKGSHESVALSKEVAVFRTGNTLKFYIKGYESGFSNMKSPKDVTIPKNEVSWINSYILSQIDGIKVVEGLE